VAARRGKQRQLRDHTFATLASISSFASACAAFFAGFMRSAQGDNLQAFAGLTGIVAASLSLIMGRRNRCSPGREGR
jgi:hypothetical protein